MLLFNQMLKLTSFSLKISNLKRLAALTGPVASGAPEGNMREKNSLYTAEMNDNNNNNVSYNRSSKLDLQR